LLAPGLPFVPLSDQKWREEKRFTLARVSFSKAVDEGKVKFRHNH